MKKKKKDIVLIKLEQLCSFLCMMFAAIIFIVELIDRVREKGQINELYRSEK